MDTLQLQKELDTIRHDVENSINELTGIITHAYSKFQKDYLSYIESDTVSVDDLISTLNNIRLLNRLCIDSDHLSPGIIPIPNENDIKLFSKDTIFAYVQKAAETIQSDLQKSRSVSNKAADIDDEDEFDQIQQDVRDLRKKLREYESLCVAYMKTIEQFNPIILSAFEANPNDNKTIASETKEDAYDTTYENDFKKWLMTNCNVSQEKAEHYISNLHSIENLYKKVFKASRTLLPSGSKNELIGIIRMLNCNTEFLDADERRDHEFSQALDALAEFAGIKEKTNSQNTNLEKTASIHFPDSEQPITINKSSKSVPTGFILKGVSYSVANWRDLYKKFVTALYHDGNYTDFIKESIKKQYFGFTDEAHKFKLQKEIKIASDFYLEGILATDVIINRVNSIIKQCSIRPEDMIINYSSAPEVDKHSSDNDSGKKGVSDGKQTETDSAREKNTECFKPDTSKPFDLKEAIIEIMMSDSPEIVEKSNSSGGFNNMIINEILKEYYKQDISIFEIIKMLMTEDIFINVGRLYYTIDKTILPDNKSNNTSVSINDMIPDPTIQISQVPELPDNSYTSSEDTELCEANEAENVPEVSSAPEIDSEKIAVPDEAKLMNEILSVIKDNSNSLEYRDGFGAYEVKTLLAKKNIIGIDEDEIELLMLESNDLKEIEEGYFVYKGETEKTADDPIKVHEISSDPKKTIQSYEPPVKSDTVPSGVKLKLNGRNEDAFDISDALIKICEFVISCKPFAMARIAKSDIAMNGKKVFCRQPAPISGYERLSNGLQVMRINNMSDLETIAVKVMNYCNIGNDMIEIIK